MVQKWIVHAGQAGQHKWAAALQPGAAARSSARVQLGIRTGEHGMVHGLAHVCVGAAWLCSVQNAGEISKVESSKNSQASACIQTAEHWRRQKEPALGKASTYALAAPLSVGFNTECSVTHRVGCRVEVAPWGQGCHAVRVATLPKGAVCYMEPQRGCCAETQQLPDFLSPLLGELTRTRSNTTLRGGVITRSAWQPVRGCTCRKLYIPFALRGEVATRLRGYVLTHEEKFE